MRTYWQRIKNIVGPALKKDFDEIGQKRTRAALEKFIVANADKNTSILDAGCNTGVEAFRLYSLGYKGKYIGVDSNSRAIKFASRNLKGNPKAKFSVDDITLLNYKTNSFDIVLIKDVIEHRQYYDKILTESARVTRKTLILSLFIKPSRFFGDKIRFHKDGYYLNRYNLGKLMSFMTDLGFIKPKKIYEDWQDVVYVFEKVL